MLDERDLAILKNTMESVLNERLAKSETAILEKVDERLAKSETAILEKVMNAWQSQRRRFWKK